MTTYVHVGSVEMSIQIDMLLLNRYSGYARTVQTVIEAEKPILRIVTGPVTYPVLSTLRKVLSDLIVIPTVDLGSHLEVYNLLQITRLLGIPDEKLYSGSFKGWTEHIKWTNLRLPEYMWLIYENVEELVDFRKYVRLAHEPFEMVVRAIELPEIKKCAESLISLMTYFNNFKIETCFNMNNDKVQSLITRLRADHERLKCKLLINPHDFPEYFAGSSYESSKSGDIVWPCAAISTVKPPVPGVSNIVSMDVVMERFHEFTCGLFKAPLSATAGAGKNSTLQSECEKSTDNTKSTDTTKSTISGNEGYVSTDSIKDSTDSTKRAESYRTFPWDNVVFAGGGATKILSSDYEKKNSRQSDVDLFIFGETFDDRKKTLDAVLEWFNTFGEERSRTYYAIRGSVISIYIKGVNRKVQIVSSNARNIYDIIGRFDMTHIQWAMWKGRYYGTPEAAIAMRTKITRFSNVRSIKAYRLVKAMVSGYDIEKSEEICEKVIDISSLVDDPTNEQLQTIIRDFHGYYYPTEMSDYDPDDELKHILAMICKDSNASMATNDPTYVKQNVVVSGNFNDSYESISFTTFNPALIMNKGQNRRMQLMTLKTKHGIMRLTSSFLTVRRAMTDDEGCKITLKAETEEFIEFTKLLEGNVYRMFRAGGVTKTLFNDGRELSIEIPRHSLDAQVSRGFSIFRNQRGQSLNIEEDLAPGDKVQFMFIVELIMTDAVRKVVLKPIKFIKYATDNGEHCEDNDDIDGEIAACTDSESTDSAGTTQNVEIKYEEY